MMRCALALATLALGLQISLGWAARHSADPPAEALVKGGAHVDVTYRYQAPFQ